MPAGKAVPAFDRTWLAGADVSGLCRCISRYRCTVRFGYRRHLLRAALDRSRTAGHCSRCRGVRSADEGVRVVVGRSAMIRPAQRRWLSERCTVDDNCRPSHTLGHPIFPPPSSLPDPREPKGARVRWFAPARYDGPAKSCMSRVGSSRSARLRARSRRRRPAAGQRIEDEAVCKQRLHSYAEDHTERHLRGQDRRYPGSIVGRHGTVRRKVTQQ
jgi:hypothetical protein